MRRLQAGMLMVVLGAVAFAPAANAAEIPPTATCLKSFDSILENLWTKQNQKLSKQERRQLSREFTIRLAEVGCISDPDPILKRVAIKPFSEECRSGAEAAEIYWAQASKTVSRLNKAWRKRVKPINKRLRRLNGRIVRLRELDASPKRIANATRVRGRLVKQRARGLRKFHAGAYPAIKPIFDNSYVILLELTSRRCLPLSDPGGGETPGPAARTFEKYEDLFMGVMLYVAFREASKHLDEGRDASASLAAISSTPDLTDKKFPLLLLIP